MIFVIALFMFMPISGCLLTVLYCRWWLVLLPFLFCLVLHRLSLKLLCVNKITIWSDVYLSIQHCSCHFTSVRVNSLCTSAPLLWAWAHVSYRTYFNAYYHTKENLNFLHYCFSFCYLFAVVCDEQAVKVD